jgi:hypothetical protein
MHRVIYLPISGLARRILQPHRLGNVDVLPYVNRCSIVHRYTATARQQITKNSRRSDISTRC